MNTIRTVKTTRDEATYFEIEVDGRRLAHHFSGRLGAHPSQLSPLDWSSANGTYRAKVVAQFLAEAPSDLESGRIPVLVCEDCGDIVCGAFTVRVIREGELINGLIGRSRMVKSQPRKSHGRRDRATLHLSEKSMKLRFERRCNDSGA